MPNADAAKPQPSTPLVNPLDAKKSLGEKTSNLVSGIVLNETMRDQSILEKAPEIDRSLLQDVEKDRGTLALALKIIFWFLVLLGLSSLIFFSSQLTDRFNFVSSKLGFPNVSKELELKNSEIVKFQTDLNFYNYLQIKAYLDEFSYYGDSFVQNYQISVSQTASEKEKSDAIESLDMLRGKLRNSLLKAREHLILPFDAPVFSLDEDVNIDSNQLFEGKLKTRLTEKANELSAVEDPEAKYVSNNYLRAVDIVGNQDIKDLILNTDFDALSDKDAYEVVRNANALITNDMSIIQKIKSSRIKWSDIINEIELRTIDVDKYYASDSYDVLGGIRYTNYDFDSANRRINISGETKRFDTKNFTVITDLIRELNNSDFFENAEMRSFTKSGDLLKGYLANLSLSLDLQQDEPIQDNQ